MQVIFKAEIFRSKSGKEKVAMINENENIHTFHEMNKKLKTIFKGEEVIFILVDLSLTNREMKILKKVDHF